MRRFGRWFTGSGVNTVLLVFMGALAGEGMARLDTVRGQVIGFVFIIAGIAVAHVSSARSGRRFRDEMNAQAEAWKRQVLANQAKDAAERAKMVADALPTVVDDESAFALRVHWSIDAGRADTANGVTVVVRHEDPTLPFSLIAEVLHTAAREYDYRSRVDGRTDDD